MKLNLSQKKDCSVVILAAGKSQRMGCPKLLLKHANKTTFIEHIINQYIAFGCRQVVCVLNPEGYDLVNSKVPQLKNSFTVAINDQPEKGRFRSIKIGLSKLKFENPVLIHNIDNPFISESILSNLLNGLGQYDYSYPTLDGKGGHPVVLSTKIWNKILQESSDDINLNLFLKQYNGLAMPVDDAKILLNINSSEDYQNMLNIYPVK